MKQKTLAKLLILAGGMATAGILFLFYGMGLTLALAGETRFQGIALLVLGVPYLFALGHYFRICENIGLDRSFCAENARRMNGVARLLFLASSLWAVTAILAALTGAASAPSGYATAPFGAFALYVRIGIALLASLAVGLVAKVMALLVGRAARLQEESDLTI